MKTIIQFIVKTPIYGYSGCGYDGDYTEKSFNKIQDAQKHLNLCDKFFKLTNDDNNFDELGDVYSELTDGNSFSIKGNSILIKRTIIDDFL